MTSQPPNPRGKRGPYAKSAQRREDIVKAAHDVFAAHGYRGGSLQEVANKVGLSQTSLLHYFPSKRELLLAVLEWRDSITGRGEARNPDDGFVQAVLRQARFNESVPGVIELYAVLCAESLTENHPGADYFTERYDRLRRSYVRSLTALASEGRLRPGVDPERAANSIIALWDGIQTQWLMAPDRVDMAACLEDYFALILDSE